MKKEDLFPDSTRCFMETSNVDFNAYLGVIRNEKGSCNEDFSFSKVYENFGQIDVEKVDGQTHKFKYKGIVYKIQSTILSYIFDNEDLRDSFMINYLTEIDRISQNITTSLSVSEEILYRDFLHITKEEYLAKLSKLRLLVSIDDCYSGLIKPYFNGIYWDKLQKVSKLECYSVYPFNNSSVMVTFNSDVKLIPINVFYFIKDKDENYLYKYFSALYENRYRFERKV